MPVGLPCLPPERTTDSTHARGKVSRWKVDLLFLQQAGQNAAGKVPAVATAEPALVLTEHPAQRALESPDGEFLYYVAGSERTPMFRRSLKTGVEEVFAATISNAANFAVTKTGVYFIGPEGPDGKAAIQFAKHSGSHVATITLSDKAPAWGMSVGPDERWLLFTQYDRMEQDLVLVENFH